MPRWMWLVPLALWAIVAGCGWAAWRLIVDGRLAVESAGWPSVPGTVISAEASTTGGYRSPIRAGVSIRYRYSVAGHDFEGHRTAFDPSYSRDGAESMVRNHPPGSQTLVYYRPSDPDVSVLEPGGSLETGWGIFMVALGVVVAAFSAWTTWFAWQISDRRLRSLRQRMQVQIHIELP